ncbi:MAG: hypothetical protein FWD24_07810 [Treponema sp.]|nr:hypothetical protein [Treponema sp.]
MIKAAQSSMTQSFNSITSECYVEILRRRINDENYLNAAIQRLALVMSNEILDISSEGGRNERKRRK